jgi:hypothetical protein
MKENNYKAVFTNKTDTGRELNAVVDFLISKKCNKTFIGNFNLTNLNGSSFSYLIAKNLPEGVKKICIDLDRITHDEQIY